MRFLLLLFLLTMLPAAGDEVNVDSNPPGAQVFDQTYTAGRQEGFLGVTPCRLRLDSTISHDLYFVLPGYATVKSRLRIGEQQLTANLPPASISAYVRHYPWILGVVLALVSGAAWLVARRFRKLERDIAVAQLDGPSLIGRVVGGYRVVSRIGDGAFSEVMRAEHIEYGDDFAIKVLRREVSDGDVRERFAREMAVGRDLRHPALVPVYAFGELDDGRPYMVLEMLHGETLERRLARAGRLPVEEVTAILEQVVEGLAYAHEFGVIHRDLKPENIMLDGDRVRIMDFGIAKLIGRARLTASNSALGTPLYMSPEHLDARTIDERSDIYSLGVIAYEMLSGGTPFEGDDTFAVLAGHLRGCAVPLDASVPPAVAAMVMRMMEREPERRFANMTEVRAALREVMRPPVEQA